MTSTKILMKVLAVLQALSDVYSYYVPLSELTWAEKDKQAIELGKLKEMLKCYREESQREVFFLRQSLKELRDSAKMLTVVTRDLFATIGKQVAVTQQDVNNKHCLAITELWRLNNHAAELNKRNAAEIQEYKKEIAKKEVTKQKLLQVKHTMAELCLSRVALRQMVKECGDELSASTKVEFEKLNSYLITYNHNLCKTVTRAPRRVRVRDIRRQAVDDEVLLL